MLEFVSDTPMIECDNNNNPMEVSIETVHIPIPAGVNCCRFGISNMVFDAPIRVRNHASVIHVLAYRMGMVPIPRYSNTKTTNERIY